ncbi:TPA: hypothetical protein HA235_01830 [Candidatus Woesearchaeota archaeon]|nr:hypothetical protein [Candidatus Woesearchaeota archaeon]HIH31424.1 hypothetical protein [Candidatus Woesearchaeota archaeon]HIJ01292.1 hypothetical protein [Candidatus Woesearchaeota archaeon]HIJ13698.1 hypothetical protein [Candidatus Woesearchaeota archaeon]
MGDTVVKKLLIITEQPNYNPINLSDDKLSELKNDITAELVEDIVECKYCKNFKKYCKGTILPLNFPEPENKHSYKRFYKFVKIMENLLKENNINWYRTHYIKHHAKSINKNNVKTECAEKFLLREIIEYKPDAIFSIGREATRWFIKKNKLNNIGIKSFRDAVNLTDNHKNTTIDFEGKRILLFAFDHPSNRNKFANKYTDIYTKNLISKCVLNIKKA